MRKQQTKSYQDLLVAINSSKSTQGFARLVQAEQLAHKLVMNGHDAETEKSFHRTVARLVRWIDEPFAQDVAESLIMLKARKGKAA